MILIIDTDGDSGVWYKNRGLNPMYVGSEKYILKIEDVPEFIELWYNNELGISDRVKEVLDYVFPEIMSALIMGYSTKVENGNYSMEVHKELFINQI